MKRYNVKTREGINQRRENFITFLKNQDFDVFPSKINAVLIKFDSEDAGTKFVNYLAKRNIIVSHGNGNSNIGLDDSYIRIAIGNKEQMDKVKKVIGNYHGGPACAGRGANTNTCRGWRG